MSTTARFTIEQYDRMIAAGVFEPREQHRLELIEGEIRAMAPIGPEHSEIVTRLTEWSYDVVESGRIRCRVQDTLDLAALESVPEPDVAWVVARDYSKRRPRAEDVLLLIEVAESSLDYDAGEKAELYAAAGIADYWVVHVGERAIEVRRDPAGRRYRTLTTHQGGEEVRPLCLPDAVLRPASLWESFESGD